MKMFLKLRILIVVGLTALLVSGCAVNPYVEPEMNRPGVVWVKSDDVWNKKEDGQGGVESRHVTVDQAVLYARSLQDAYRKASAGISRARTGLDALVIGSAVTATGMAVSGGDPETAGLIGLGAATLGFSGDRFLVPIRKRIYFQGALALECVIGAASASSIEGIRSLELSVAEEKVKAALAKVEADLQEFEEHRAAYEENDKELSKSGRRLLFAAFNGANSSIRIANATLRVVNQTKSRIDPLGSILISKVEGIRIRVDAEVARQEPDLIGYADALRGVLNATPGSAVSNDIRTNLLGDGGGAFDTKYNIFENHKELDDAYDHLDKSTGELDNAVKALWDVAESLINDPPSYSAETFKSCDFNKGIGLGPLALSRSEIEIIKGQELRTDLMVTGGRMPYRIIEETLPAGVAAELSAGQAGAILSVTIPTAASSTLTTAFIVTVADADNHTQGLLVKLKREQSGGGPEDKLPKTAEQLKIEAVQRYLNQLNANDPILKDDPLAIDGIVADSQGNEKTRQRLKAFIKANGYDQLKKIPDIKDQFADKTEGEVLANDTLMVALVDAHKRFASGQ